MLTAPISPADHVLGRPDAPVTLVEYGDYQCPYCGVAHPIVQQVIGHFGNDIRFVFRHFPLRELHPCAWPAAQTAEFAATQNRFWEMHDRLFENQRHLETESLMQSVAALHLDVNQWRRALSSGAFDERIFTDLHSGARSGVNGTPTFFINGTRHDGSFEFNALVHAIDAAVPD